MNLTSAAGTWREPPATAGVRAVAVGSAVVLLGLHAGVALVEMLGWRVPGLAAALDPGQAGSLPALWGETMLALAALASIGLSTFARDARLLPLAALPATLVVIEAGDLAAHLATLVGDELGGSFVMAKLTAELIAGVLVLLALALSWPAYCISMGAASTLLLGLTMSLGCDLLAAWLGGGPDRALLVAGLQAVEESAEFLLYAGVASIALGRAMEPLAGKFVPMQDNWTSTMERCG